MTTLTLNDISETMRDIDICMLTTHSETGETESRPMSNNRQVDYNGDSYFFTRDLTTAALQIAQNPNVSLSYVHKPVLGKSFYLSVTGKAVLIKDRAEIEDHWVADLEAWFENGIDTPDLVMIHVKASRLKYWNGMEEGELNV